MDGLVYVFLRRRGSAKQTINQGRENSISRNLIYFQEYLIISDQIEGRILKIYEYYFLEIKLFSILFL